MKQVQAELEALLKGGVSREDERVVELWDILRGNAKQPVVAVPAHSTSDSSSIEDIKVSVIDGASVNSIAHGKGTTDAVNTAADNECDIDAYLRTTSAIFRLKSTYKEGGREFAVLEDDSHVEFVQKYVRLDHLAIKTAVRINSDYATYKPLTWPVIASDNVSGVQTYNATTALGVLRLVSLTDMLKLCSDETAKIVKQYATKIVIKLDGKPLILFDWYETYHDDGSPLYSAILDIDVPDFHDWWLHVGAHHVISPKVKGSNTVNELTDKVLKLCQL